MAIAVAALIAIAPAVSHARGGGGGGHSGGGHSGGGRSGGGHSGGGHSHGSSSHGRYATASSHYPSHVSGRRGLSTISNIQVVAAHYTKNGEYVQSYHATNPNHTTRDNFSTVGNVNPFTGAVGTKPNVRP
jgi:hypothetical protein